MLINSGRLLPQLRALFFEIKNSSKTIDKLMIFLLLFTFRLLSQLHQQFVSHHHGLGLEDQLVSRSKKQKHLFVKYQIITSKQVTYVYKDVPLSFYAIL